MFVYIIYIYIYIYMGGCQNYGPFLGLNIIRTQYLGYPKRDHNFDNYPYIYICYLHTCMYAHVYLIVYIHYILYHRTEFRVRGQDSPRRVFGIKL